MEPQLVESRPPAQAKADRNIGFVLRTAALCPMPRREYGVASFQAQKPGPYTLEISAGSNNKLPCGKYPRLFLIWGLHRSD